MRKLRTGMMPPDGAPKPAPAARETFTAALEAALDRLAARQLDPGAPALHRLNRRGIRERDSRPARARRRRQRAAAAGRFGRRLRQHRRRARRLARADRGLRGGGREDQPARHWRSVHRSRSRGLSRARRSVAGRAPRRPSARHARRHHRPPHVPARCRVRPAGGAGGAAHALAGRRRQARAQKISTSRSTARGSRCRGAARRAFAFRQARTPSPQRLSCARGRRAPTASSTSRRARPASRRSPSPARSTRPAPATRRAGGVLLICTPPASADEEPCAKRILSTLATRAYRRPVARVERRDADAARVLPRRAAECRFRVRHPACGRARAGRSAVPLPLRARAGRASQERRIA